MNHSLIPETLPRGTWIRSGHGPLAIYSEATLVRPGERGRRGLVRDHYCYESGDGSATVDFLPERVHWDAVASRVAHDQIEKVCRDFYALGSLGCF